MSNQFQPIDQISLKKLFESEYAAGGIIRDLSEWNKYVPKAHEALIRRAQAVSFDRLPISYGELGGKIALFSPDYFPLKIAAILWGCSEFEHAQGRPLITSIVVNQDTNQPGMGFWGVSGIPASLRKATSLKDDLTAGFCLDDKRQEFWVNEMRRVSDYWNSKIRA